MKWLNTSRLQISAMTLLAVACANAGDSVPTERVGVTPKSLVGIELPATFDMSKGRSLRMREATIEPGGSLPMHSHNDRPAVAYVLQGTLSVYVEGEDTPQTYKAGDYYAIYKASHAMRNKGSEKVVFIEVDLP